MAAGGHRSRHRERMVKPHGGPVDLVAVALDDALLDRIAVGGPAGDDRRSGVRDGSEHVHRMLAAWPGVRELPVADDDPLRLYGPGATRSPVR